MLTQEVAQTKRSVFDYSTVWRWHFYAGLFCIPFVIWLSVTGSIYLFKPQIESWLDRPYESLKMPGPPATAAAQVQAAIHAVPGSNLHYYQLPRTSHSAVQIIVGHGTTETRVYVHPQTLAILNIIDEEDRPMRKVFRLHGELMLGDRGSMIVELAASWAIVMIVTGLYLWWPRTLNRLAGIIYPRLNRGSRTFWRDIHAVTGIWVSFFALFLLLTGLPWSKNWGGYLKKVRQWSGSAVVRQDWTTGRSSELAQRMAMSSGTMSAMSMEHAEHMNHRMHIMISPDTYVPLDRMVATVSPLHLAFPVLVSPPMSMHGNWTAKSDAQKRTVRTNLELDGVSGRILKREDFDQRPWIDRAVGIGVAAHEGQLFGIANQLLGLFTAIGLLAISLSAIVLWWKRRPLGQLGAPLPARQTTLSIGKAVLILGFALFLPLLGASLIVVVLSERFVVRRIPAAAQWLGLRPI